jgi:hypothetical protein
LTIPFPQLKYRKRLSTKRLILHDSHTVPGRFDLKNWLTLEGRRQGLLSIGYHFLVLEDGQHWMTRPHDTVGSHTPGFNHDSVGICLAGGRREVSGEDGEILLRPADTFSKEQLEGLHWLVDHLEGNYGPLLVAAHTELGRHQHKHDYPCPALRMDDLRGYLSLNR